MASENSLTDGGHFVLRPHPRRSRLPPARGPIVAAFAALATARRTLLRPRASRLARLASGAVAVLTAMIWLAIPQLRWRRTGFEILS